MIRWTGDVGYWADGRVPWPVAWVSVDGWRVPGTSGSCSTRAESRQQAELCLAEIVQVEVHVAEGRQRWTQIRSLLATEPLSVPELAQRTGLPIDAVGGWLRRRRDEVRPVGLRRHDGAERWRHVVVWGLR